MTDKQKAILKKVGFPAYWIYKKVRKKARYKHKKKHPMETADRIFYRRFGRHIDWDNPRDLNEKINWLKFHADPYEWARLADKYRVREYVKERGLEEILVPLYGKWDSTRAVLKAWDSLPEEFVLKSNNGYGSRNILVVSSETGGKDAVDRKLLKKTLKQWLDQKECGLAGAELHYQFIENCIIAEKLLKDDLIADYSRSLIDYKIWCLDGKPYGCLVIYDRHVGGHYVEDWYDLEWNHHTEYVKDQSPRHPIPKPKNWERMLEVASILSKGHPQVRVDLYNIDGKVYFGEMTFTSYGGYENYNPTLLQAMGDQVKLDLNTPGNQFMPIRRKQDGSA